MGVDVGVEADPGGGGVGAEVALVHDPLLVRGQSEPPLPRLPRLLLRLQVPVDRVAVGDDARGLGLGLSVVENSVIEGL